MASADEKQSAFTYLAQGKRHLLVKDYFEAVSSLALACEHLATIYGDNAIECGEAYFSYGKALLELARSENGVLGNAVEEEVQSGEEDDDDEEEDEAEESEDKVQKSEVKSDQNGNGDASHKTSGEDAEAMKVNDGEGKEKAAHVSKEGDESEATNGNDDGEDGEVSNLNLAWEVLELAKSIFQKQSLTDKSVELKLADVHLLLGEVSLESENFTQGIEDMLACLELQKTNLPTDDRLIAETYYQIGLGNGMANNFDVAIQAYSNCAKVLENRVANLKNFVKEGVKPQVDDPFYTYETEIKNLEDLFPEIQLKIADMEDFKNETRKAMINVVSGKGEGSDPGAGSSSDPTPVICSSTFESSGSSAAEAKPVSNISHLVRKKPRADVDPEPSETNDAKRVRVDNDEAP